MWNLVAECEPSAPIRRSNGTSSSGARWTLMAFSPFWEVSNDPTVSDGARRSNQALLFSKSAPVNLWLKKSLTFGVFSSSSRRIELSLPRSMALINLGYSQKHPHEIIHVEIRSTGVQLTLPCTSYNWLSSTRFPFFSP